MTKRIAFILFIALLLQGCTIPCDVYFRNLSAETLRLNVQLIERRFFNKLPNKVNLYALPEKEKDICGKWIANKLVTWTDSIHFYIDVPPNVVIDIKDVSNGLTLGAKQPSVILIAASTTKLDTLITSDYAYLPTKFTRKNKGLGNPIYYYDFK